MVFWKYQHFYYDNLDLAIFNNVFFNTLRGNFFAATIHPPTYLGDHFSPFIFLLIPFYALKPGPEILLILETLAIGSTAVPIFGIAKKLIPKPHSLLPLGLTLLWLTNPLVHNMNFFEFELLPFAVLFLFMALYFYVTEKKVWFILALILALLVREDVTLMTFAIGLLGWIDRRSAFWKWTPILLSIVYGAISFSVTSYYAPTGIYKFLVMYGWLGGTTAPTILLSFITHPLKVLLHLLTWDNFVFILGLTFPFFFLAITRSKYLILLVLPLLQLWLTANGGSPLILMTHFSGYLLVGLIMLLIDRISHLESNNKWPRLIPSSLRNKKFLY